MSDSPSKPLPSAYEIAAPQTYDAFDLSAAATPAVGVPKTSSIDLAQKESAQKTRADKPKKTADDWIDSKDETPKVKEKDKDKFEGPDEPSGGIAKFAASLEVVGGTPREKRAVWVVHGMGQQIPFETLDSLANGILDVLPNPTQIKPRLRTVRSAIRYCSGLNRLMLDDWLCNGALQVAERTATMVTFGSPLNKTAFLFTIQGKDTLHIRERLAATVQPLIMSYPKFRRLKWINVYSRNDIVSGDLKFYDLPGYQDDPVPAVAVQNVKDRDAAVPLVAHVAYWKNKTVWRELLSAIAP